MRLIRVFNTRATARKRFKISSPFEKDGIPRFCFDQKVTKQPNTCTAAHQMQTSRTRSLPKTCPILFNPEDPALVDATYNSHLDRSMRLLQDVQMDLGQFTCRRGQSSKANPPVNFPPISRSAACLLLVLHKPPYSIPFADTQNAWIIRRQAKNRLECGGVAIRAVIRRHFRFGLSFVKSVIKVECEYHRPCYIGYFSALRSPSASYRDSAGGAYVFLRKKGVESSGQEPLPNFLDWG